MIARVLLVLASSVVAILVAGLLLAVAIWGWMLAGSGFARIDFVLLQFIVLFAVPLTLLLSSVPVLITVIAGEWAGKRTLGYYTATGVLSGLVALGFHIGLAFWRNASARRIVTEAGTTEGAIKLGAVILMCALVGLIGGAIYWALAGRRAGLAQD
jgi:hypothetical protein